MNKNTFILLLALALLLIPTGVVLKAYSADKFEIMATESGVAYMVGFLQTEKMKNKPADTAAKTLCTACKGTKKVLTGDKLHSVPCECGANCKCQPASTVPQTNTRLVLLTAPGWCNPCRLIDSSVLPALKARGWTFGKNAQIEVIDTDINPDHGYNVSNGIPTWILLEDGKETNRWTGFANGYGVGKIWNKQVITTEDVRFIPYKEKK